MSTPDATDPRREANLERTRSALESRGVDCDKELDVPQGRTPVPIADLMWSRSGDYEMAIGAWGRIYMIRSARKGGYAAFRGQVSYRTYLKMQPIAPKPFANRVDARVACDLHNKAGGV